MIIATWNINSIKARLSNVTEWLRNHSPDVVLLQEIKCETLNFPALEFEALGYKSYAVGQKSYNGVALLSRHPIEDVLDHLPEGNQDPQARYIEATIKNVRIANLYLPNGNPTQAETPASISDKFAYKLAWMERLKRHAATLLEKERPVVLGGDYNIIPEAIDVYDLKGWEQDALFHPLSRAAYRKILQLGYTEAFRALHPNDKEAYTFWDYQNGCWPRDHGLRIDHFLLSPEATDLIKSCSIDREPRGQEKASDHTPVLLELNI